MEVTEIQIGVIKYFITECPRIDQLKEFKYIIIKNKVNILIRILEPYQLYNISDIPDLTVENFTNFQDGLVPTKEIIDRYIHIIEDAKKRYKNPNILVHCLSSLGRCPTLIAVSMIEENPRVDHCDVITYIRKKRPGAFNSKQIKWILNLKMKKKFEWKFWCN